MMTMTSENAWRNFVGDQTPEEFWELSKAKGCKTFKEAAEEYANDLPNIFQEHYEINELENIATLLEQHLEENLKGGNK